VTRRQTGGGGIYHDAYGDVAYSIAVPAADVPGKLLDCYHLLCEPVLDAFDRLGSMRATSRRRCRSCTIRPVTCGNCTRHTMWSREAKRTAPPEGGEKSRATPSTGSETP